MGLRWSYDPDDPLVDIKFSGLLAKVAVELGYVRRDLDVDHIRLNRDQVKAIVAEMADFVTVFPENVDQLDLFKLTRLEEWLANSKEDSILFC